MSSNRKGRPAKVRLTRRVETETEKILAVLREVVEDSQPPQRWGFGELRRGGFSESVLVALEGVTRREGETCEDSIRRSLTHPVACRVKLADLEITWTSGGWENARLSRREFRPAPCAMPEMEDVHHARGFVAGVEKEVGRPWHLANAPQRVVMALGKSRETQRRAMSFSPSHAAA